MKATRSPREAIAAALVRARELVAEAKARRPVLIRKGARRPRRDFHV